MGVPGMKVHHLSRGFWDHDSPSLTLACKRFRPLAPKITTATATSAVTSATAFDLKSFIKPECGSSRAGSSDSQKKESTQVEAVLAGGTRWNPTQEQIGLLEMLYRGGMRTPNAQQIEQITAQLSKYGKIEGKNVFYWFQNHKARERQKQKRNSLGLSHSPRTPPSSFSPPTSLFLSSNKESGVEEKKLENSPYKRKCMAWGFDQCLEQNKIYNKDEEEEEEGGQDRTLKLFPLHPEGRLSCSDY